MLNEQVTGGGHAGHSMGNMKGMNHDDMKSKPAMDMKSRPAMEGMDHNAIKDMPADLAQSHAEHASSEHQHGAASVDEPTMPTTHKEEIQPMKFELIPNAHPLAVHFPITLTLIALLFSLAARVRHKHSSAIQLATVGHWSLWLAALMAVIAAVFGWLAYNSVNHDDAGHAAMLIHRNWAIPTAGGLVILAILDAWKSRATQLMRWPVLVVLFILSVSVAVTGWLGGEVVYRHGIGVLALPESEEGMEGHHHEHGAAGGHEHYHETADEEPAAEHHHH